MRRLITSRGVRLALAVGAAAMVVIAIVTRLHRSRSPIRSPIPIPIRARRDSGPLRHDAPPAGASSPAQAGSPARAVSGPVPPWPPVPVLGVPTAEDLKRHDAGPSALRSAVERFLARSPRSPREPLNKAARRRLRLWGAAGLAFLLLAGTTQALESAVFPSGTPIEDSGRYARSCTQGRDPLALTYACTDDGPRADAVLGEEPSSPPTGPSEPSGPPEQSESPVPDVTPETPEPDHGPATDADCRPAPAVPRVRPVDPRVTRAVNRQWRRIERWLRTNAPASRRTLGRPARARTIAVAEAQTGLRFPDSLRASLLRHDGTVFVEGVWRFGFQGDMNLSVREIRDTWRMLCRIDSGDGGEGALSDPRSEWWDGRMIPITADGSGNHLVVDSVRRDVGGTDHEGNMRFTVGGIAIRSYYALLKATADALETGGSIGHMRPRAVDGRLEWEVAESSPATDPGASGSP
ncbi:SMI1/KNR4 family protein [Streptosporangium sp. NPDC050855]|uniref:SMI1/KNR4 family protein n=1 Tax=Streptosporangium sp. NPDC050855 TaxID=3366194 RepID=UPI0037980F69